MTASPTYLLAAAPVEPSRFKKFFESGDGSVRKLLEHPGALRYAGWNLETSDTARIVKGELLEVKDGDRKVLNLYEDGTLIVRAAVDDTFLAWGSSEAKDKTNLRLHPMALMEFTYSFVDFYARLTAHFESPPSKLRLRIELQSAILADAKLYLLPYKIGTPSWIFHENAHFAPEASFLKNIEITTSELLQTPPKVTYELIKQLYLWFSFPPEVIPYTVVQDESKTVDVAQIGKK